MYDGQVVVDILAEMPELALMNSINPNTKEGRLQLIGHYIDKFRLEAELIRKDVVYVGNAAYMAEYIANEIVKIEEREDRIHAVWVKFLLKHMLVSTEIHAITMICFFIPILVDCWDNKI